LRVFVVFLLPFVCQVVATTNIAHSIEPIFSKIVVREGINDQVGPLGARDEASLETFLEMAGHQVALDAWLHESAATTCDNPTRRIITIHHRLTLL
jgi:hypothetical protein